MDVIEIALKKTTSKANPNFDYINKLLTDWHDRGFKTANEVQEFLTEIKNKLTKIVEESQNGQFIKNGITIAIIGRPNVGKSSLLNALLEEDKAIVTDISGTTRDIVEGEILYKGINLKFIDTAGIRETNDIVEKIGVQKSLAMKQKADITILVLNNNEPLTQEEKELLKSIENQKAIIFINKIDLEPKLETLATSKKIIKGSTLTKNGIEELKQEIIKQDQKDKTKILGRSRGIFAMIVNDFSTGSIYVTFITGMNSIIGHPNITSIILVTASLLLSFLLWFFLKS